MSQKEIKRIKVMELLVNGKLSNQEAAEALGLCRRQIIRLKKKYLAQGEVALIHGNRNRPPRHRIEEQRRHKVVSLYQEKHHDFNFSHFTDSLKEIEGIGISRSSVARVLTGFQKQEKRQMQSEIHRACPRFDERALTGHTRREGTDGSSPEYCNELEMALPTGISGGGHQAHADL
ncbi:MAG: helix-turn-helix domain-containing protein [Fretibacterium sp.]|nr:helix-turn-helix domain-containing protein [Fretibacterium sp.]